jgi:hypothetical protein
MNAEQIIVDHKEFYFNADTLEDPKVIRVFLFEDPQLEHVAKNPEGKTRMVDKEQIHENLNEWGGGGAGYAVWGGGSGRQFGNPSSGGRFTGRGFGFGQSSNNNGGSNLMYTYSIEPLNQTLQTKPTMQEEGEYIHVGTEIRGKVLGKDRWVEAQVLSIEEDSDNNTSSYTVLDPDTAQSIKIDPTSAEVLKKELSPEMIVRDVVGENYYPRIGEFLNEKIDFERTGDPLKAMKIGKEYFKLSEDEIFDVVDQYFEEAEQFVFATYPDMKYTHKQYDEAFNQYIKEKEPRLKYDKRNFYKIYCKYGPQ